MGKVIELPSRAAQGMAYLDAEIRQLMATKGESDEAIELALDTLKDVYSRYEEIGKQRFSVKLPPELSEAQLKDIQSQIEKGITVLTEEHRHIINILAAELVITKLKLLSHEESQGE